MNQLEKHACRGALIPYIIAMWPKFTLANHLSLVAAHLQAVERGEIKRLIIAMPPRHGKSTLLSEFFPAWYLGRNPSSQIIFSTYAQGFASSFGRKVRNQLFDPVFKEIFPRCHIAQDSKAKHQFNTLEGGIYNAVGRGGSITGKGANLLILDDLIKDDQEAESKTLRDNLKEWLTGTALTRLEPNGSVILNATRWHEDDPIGWAKKDLKKEGWVCLELPALNDAGEALWPERYPTDRLLQIKERNLYQWNALFQQRPSSRAGNLFLRDAWTFYRQLPVIFDTMIQSWDLSFKAGEDTSFVVGQVWGVLGAKFYLVHQFRKQINFNDTILAIAQVSTQFPATYTKLVEDKANGPAILSFLKDKIAGLEEFNPNEWGSKEARAAAISHFQNNGNIVLPHPDENPWVLDFMERCANFPKVDAKDEIDAMSQALIHLNKESLANWEKILAI